MPDNLSVSNCNSALTTVMLRHQPSANLNNGWILDRFVLRMCKNYSIVKDSNADSGVIFRFLQNSPTTKAVCTKISNKNFCNFGKILIFLRENKEASFLIF